MPRSTEKLVPACRVKVNGAPLPPRAASDLLAVEVEEDVGVPAMFTLRLLNWDMKKLAVTWSEDRLFSVGNDVVVEMGYVDRLQPLVEGEITGLEPEFAGQDPPLLTVRGHDLRHRLMRGARTRSFLKAKDSDIASRIAREHRLRAKVKSTRVSHEYVLQHDQSDWAFLEERARRIDYELAMEGKTLSFRPRRNGAGPALELQRTDLLEFYPRLTALGQVGEVTVRGWDPKAVKPFAGKAPAGAVGARMGGRTSGPAAATRAFGKASDPHVDLGLTTLSAAKQAAQGLLRQRALDYLSGEGMIRGRSELKAGAVVAIQGVGKRFSGDYYVLSSRHTYGPQEGYRTAFHLRRNAS